MARSANDALQFLAEDEVPRRPGEVVFREGLTRNLVGFIIYGGLTVLFWLAATVLPMGRWGYGELVYFAYPAGVFGLLVSALSWRSVRGTLADSNWLLRMAPEGLYLRYRSYLNRDFPGQPVAVFLPKREIKWLRQMREVGRRIGESGEETWTVRLDRLEIKLRQEDLSALNEQLKAERQRYAAGRFIGKGKSNHYPVRALPEGIIQIEWKGMQSATKPKIGRALELLGRAYPTEAAGQREQPPIKDLDREAQEAEVLALTEAGETIQAVKLARQLYGFSLTEAKAFVDGLSK
ncbi:MAG: hypothetical protein QF578_17335 [Alphaproteobacteria bacterium]|mgnify:CR=1 FL=1|jgi:hypothetical protein|nr:hypothetical protein [Alphaproteobacteria bacterium]MDP6811969.1 hypothetical protein [Alphaproteobacteria bacterium]